jgi:hypothetical protein
MRNLVRTGIDATANVDPADLRWLRRHLYCPQRDLATRKCDSFAERGLEALKQSRTLVVAAHEGGFLPQITKK